MKLRVEPNKNQQPELVNGGGINSDTNVLSVVTKNLLSPCTFARYGLRNVGTFLLMLLMLQFLFLLTIKDLLDFYTSCSTACESVNINLLWNCYGDFTSFRVVAVTKNRILYMGKYLICSGFSLCFYMKILLGNKTLVLRSISVSEIGPNVVSEHINLRMVECVLLYAVHYISSGPQKLKISIHLLFSYSNIKKIIFEL